MKTTTADNIETKSARLSSQIHRSDFSLAIIKDGELVKITPPPSQTRREGALA
jgi:hypothetical protein